MLPLTVRKNLGYWLARGHDPPVGASLSDQPVGRAPRGPIRQKPFVWREFYVRVLYQTRRG